MCKEFGIVWMVELAYFLIWWRNSDPVFTGWIFSMAAEWNVITSLGVVSSLILCVQFDCYYLMWQFHISRLLLMSDGHTGCHNQLKKYLPQLWNICSCESERFYTKYCMKRTKVNFPPTSTPNATCSINKIHGAVIGTTVNLGTCGQPHLIRLWCV